jgi:hypothetical protein
MGWGRSADTGRRVMLWLLGGLTVATLALLSVGYGSAEARAAEQGTYCLRSGPHTSMALWSEDEGRTWR